MLTALLTAMLVLTKHVLTKHVLSQVLLARQLLWTLEKLPRELLLLLLALLGSKLVSHECMLTVLVVWVGGVMALGLTPTPSSRKGLGSVAKVPIIIIPILHKIHMASFAMM